MRSRLVALIALFSSLVLAPAGAESRYADELAAAGKIAIPIEQAREIEGRLGQLFVVNVDGFGWAGPRAVSPGYEELITALQIGGVIPHYGSTSYERIRAANRALAGLTELPLLVCLDIVKLSAAGKTASFGDGFVGGMLGRYRRLPDPELRTLAGLDAFTLAALGANVLLGPTIDTSTGDSHTADRARIVIGEFRRYGIEPVIKHFPFLPAGANLHRESPDTKVPREEAMRRSAVFGQLANEAGILMTTHLRDTLVDPQIATFSPTWNRLLHDCTGFNGLLMSDGLFMLSHYAGASALGGGPRASELAGLDPVSSWALRAILAGHDLIIVEGSAAQTTRTFRALLAYACGNAPLAARLRARIEESWARIRAWKLQNEETLRRTVDVPRTDIAAVIGLMPGDDAKLSSFRFDPKALGRVAPALAEGQLPVDKESR